MVIRWCGACHKECDVHVIDEGIGHYEFWGAKGVDTQLTLETDCCGDKPYEDPECTIECDDANEYVSDRADEAADAKYHDRKEDY